jgi:hypothetical protein
VQNPAAVLNEDDTQLLSFDPYDSAKSSELLTVDCQTKICRKPENAADAQACANRAQVLNGAANLLIARAKLDKAAAVRRNADFPSTLNCSRIDSHRHPALLQKVIIAILRVFQKMTDRWAQYLVNNAGNLIRI